MNGVVNGYRNSPLYTCRYKPDVVKGCWVLGKGSTGALGVVHQGRNYDLGFEIRVLWNGHEGNVGVA